MSVDPASWVLIPRPTKRGALVPDVLLGQAMRSASAQPFDSVPLKGAGPLVWSCDSWCPSKVGYRLYSNRPAQTLPTPLATMNTPTTPRTKTKIGRP
jgi:hypothetical protein